MRHGPECRESAAAQDEAGLLERLAWRPMASIVVIGDTLPVARSAAGLSSTVRRTGRCRSGAGSTTKGVTKRHASLGRYQDLARAHHAAWRYGRTLRPLDLLGRYPRVRRIDLRCDLPSMKKTPGHWRTGRVSGVFGVAHVPFGGCRRHR